MTYLIVQLTRNEVLWGRFQRQRGELAFLGGGRHPLAGEPTFDDLLKELAGTRREEEKVVLTLPPSSLFLRELDLPLTDRRKARQVLPLELKGETAIDTDELVFDAILLADGKTLAVWTRRTGVADLIRTMTEAGLEPETVSAAPLHWPELFAPSDTTEPVAITDGEALVVALAGRLLFCRPLGGGDPFADVARTLAALELGKNIAVREVLLHGDLARQPLPTTTSGLTFRPLPLADATARAFAGDAGAARDLASTYAVAAACGSGAAVNFRSGTLAYTAGNALARRKFRLPLVLAAILVVALIAETTVRYYLVRRDLNSLDTSIFTIYRQVFPSRKKPVDAVGELKGEIRRLSGRAATGNVLAALTKAAELKGDDITGIYEAEFDSGQLRLKGDARSTQGVNDFKTRTAAAFSDGEVSEIKSKPDGTVSFLFRGTFKEEKK
ncbi:type II secretion system protein GspL [Geobacter sp. AOG1]|uniref:type II secretion system protein GspL n=1 Tax=Geobacter sp. AOG1 TaxID=1566346 RepID=UPI001CC818E6|nr:type II secretion system protein GspL [Geobacter sp. AOG1]GFE57253.1 type II secretion system protein GspL [Geobacter sp. AOG1]